MHGLCAFSEWCRLRRSYRYVVAIIHAQRASPRNGDITARPANRYLAHRRHYLRLRILPILKISFPCTFPIFLGLKTKEKPRRNQGRTKDEPKNSKLQKSTFIKIAISFTSLIPCLSSPTDDRENSERTPTEDLMTKKALFL